MPKLVIKLVVIGTSYLASTLKRGGLGPPLSWPVTTGQMTMLLLLLVLKLARGYLEEEEECFYQSPVALEP